jgi:hypothetical protein
MEVSGQRYTPAALLQGKRPGTDFIRDGVSPPAGLDGCGKSRPPYWGSIHGPSSPQRVALPITLSARLAT